MRNPEGNPVKGTICAIMMLSIFPYFAWIYLSPLNLITGTPLGSLPSLPILIVDTLLYVPLIYQTIRYWLRNMTRRKSGPAAGIDVVEPGRVEPEPGDELGTVTRRYSEKSPPRIMGPKSEIRDTPTALADEFFVKLPDIDTGIEIFDSGQLISRAMVRSKVSSGGWIGKRVSSRGSGSLKASDAATHGRPRRWRTPSGVIGSLHIPATIMAAVARTGRLIPGGRIRIQADDLREKVFASRTPLTVILVVDVSLSMKSSAAEVRRLIERIESETRGSRDRCGIVAFKDSGAVEVQSPTTNWNKIYRALARLKSSGLTPLANGMVKALETIRRERMRNPDVEPLVVLISDFAPNIPLAQTARPGDSEYTPVRDLVRAARLLRKERVRLAAVNVDKSQMGWTRVLKLPYHDALELAVTLRMRKEGLFDPVETVLSVSEFRKEFGAFLVARVADGRAYLSTEILREKSVIGAFLRGSQTRSRLRKEDLRSAESYLR
ncbi:MAG: VWA domain-containing protein [Candidatus Thorarchaeota archaeon]|nr:VWA domain-containing protein [Candidatus Thorarchaeota archaeon]